jgi:hypothetical protein
MSIKHAIWKVGEEPAPLAEASLGKEALLEQMIVKDSAILSDRWMLIGRQVRTDHGGIIDLLALNQEGQIILIELKRDATPREVVAQALDYASWVQELAPEEVAAVYEKFSNGASLGAAFQQKFNIALDEEQLNGSHQIVIVASVLDASTERIVNYLSGMNIPINVIFFQVFQDGDRQYLSRAWLIDPIETETKATSSTVGPKGEWNGEYYVSFGHGTGRKWADAQKYGFISAGYGAWYTQTLSLLSPGDRVWVNIPKCGYVGVGRVTGPSVPLRDFRVQVDGIERPFLEVAEADYARASIDNDDQCEYFVPVEWLATRSTNEAISEVGFFGNQNTVCRPRTTKWDHTVKRLKTLFSITDQQAE